MLKRAKNTPFLPLWGAYLVQIYYKFITKPAFVINRNSNAVSWSIFPHVTSLYCEKWEKDFGIFGYFGKKDFGIFVLVVVITLYFSRLLRMMVSFVF